MAKDHQSFQLILGDQLFPLEQAELSKAQPILMIEDYDLCCHYRYHKHKITLFLTAMRDYRDQLIEKGYQVSYFSGNHKLFDRGFDKKLDEFLSAHPKIKRVEIFEVSDSFFREFLQSFFSDRGIEIRFKKNPGFITDAEFFRTYLKGQKKILMGSFYIQQRKQFDILLEKNGKPKGGLWSFDKENRKKYPKAVQFPKALKRRASKNLAAVKALVDEHFSHHPGYTENFWLHTDREGAVAELDYFLTQKFQEFGPYEDAIHTQDVFGFHSVISPYLNLGLITPKEVVDQILKFGIHVGVPLPSIEGYIRQVIGWREFVKGIYDNFEEKMSTSNFWESHRDLTSDWYEGTTGILPLDDSIKKADQFGYTHHIERLMILSNIMLLSEIHPYQVYCWFMEMYVDSADWVMAANVYGMGQMSDGGIFATKPYICGSNYILKMSNYKKGEWCDTLDGLYWRFIEKHQEKIKSNPRMSMMIRMLKKIEPERKKRIFKAAEEFIETSTVSI